MGNQAKATHTAAEYNKQSTCTLCKKWLTTTLDQGSPRINPPSTTSKNPPRDTITIHCYDGRRHTKRKERQAEDDSTLDGINTRHSSHTPTRCRYMGRNGVTDTQTDTEITIWKQQQLLKFLTNLSEERLVFLRKASKEVSETLAGAVSELWAVRVAIIKQIEQTEQAQSKLDQQQRKETSPLPPNQPTMESFWQSPTSTPTTLTTTVNSQKAEWRTRHTTD